MNSIDKRQAGEHSLDLTNEDAVNKIKELTSSTKTCFFCTRSTGGLSEGVRPMSVLQVDEAGTCWFLSAIDSYKNQELETDGSVDLYFQGSSHSDFLHLRGTALVSKDKGKIKELWSPLLKTWFTEGADDPRISVIKFVPQGGYYWDTKHGNVVSGVKIAFGALIGKTMDDSIQGAVRL